MRIVAYFLVLFLVGCSVNHTERDDFKHNHHAMTLFPFQGNVLNCSVQSGHHIYVRDVSCPIGKENFKTLTLGTHSTMGRHLDWEPISYMRFPIAVPVCPSNGFVVFKQELALYKQVIDSEEYQKLFSENHASYFLLAKQMELAGKADNEQWWRYLQASWEADNCGNKNRYREYAELVVKEGRRTLSTLKIKDDVYWVLNIIIANMHRRIGDFDAAYQLMICLHQCLIMSKVINFSV